MSTVISRIDPAVTGSISLISPIVTLERDMIWVDEFLWRQVEAVVTLTIGGGIIVQQQTCTEKGRIITLESRGGFGMQPRSVVAALKAQADVLDALYYLEITDGSQSLARVVRFRNEEEDGAVQFAPAADRDGIPSDTFYYSGRIQLMVDEWG